MDNNQELTGNTLGLGTSQPLLSMIYSLKRMREYYEPMGYLSRRAYEGKHFVYWDREANKLQEIPIKKTFFNQMAETAKQTDAFENFILNTNFVFTLIPKQLSKDSAVNEAMYLSALAKTYYDKFRESTTASDYIHYALMDNVAFVEPYPDVINKTVGYRRYDFYDILFDPRIHNWDEQRLVVKVVRKKISELRQSKLYTIPADYSPKGGGEYLTWKDIYEQEKYSQFADLAPDETIIFECFSLDPKDGLQIITIDAATNVLRNDKYPNIKMMPIIPFRIYSGEWYQPSYVYRQIPINRSIDTLSSRFDDIILRLAKGGWIVQEEEDIDGGMNEDMGQIVNYASTKPEQMQMGTVPGFFPEWFSMLLSLAERYGLNSIFTGGLPNKASGLRSNKMIESIKGLALQNNTSSINSYKSAVKAILKVTFMYLYEMWDTPQEMLASETGDDAPKFISAKRKDLYTDQNVIGVPSDFKKFEVEVDDGMGYTLEERKKIALELYQTKDEQGKPILSSNAVKKIFKLGSSGYLMEADEPSMHDTQEFKNLIKNFPNLQPEQQQAVITMLQTVGQQVGNDKKYQNPEMVQQLMQQAKAGQTGNPAMPAAPTQPVQPQQQPKPQIPQGGGGK